MANSQQTLEDSVAILRDGVLTIFATEDDDVIHAELVGGEIVVSRNRVGVSPHFAVGDVREITTDTRAETIGLKSIRTS